MDGPSIIFALATTLVVVSSLRRTDALLASLALAATCLISDIVALCGLSRDFALSANVASDWFLALAFIITWRIVCPPKAWLFVIAVCALLQVMLHWTTDLRVMGAAYRLTVAVNLLYAAQLLTVVIGPRAGQLVGHARSVFRDWSSDSRDRVRTRGVAQAIDRRVRAIGGESFPQQGEAE